MAKSVAPGCKKVMIFVRGFTRNNVMNNIPQAPKLLGKAIFFQANNFRNIISMNIKVITDSTDVISALLTILLLLDDDAMFALFGSSFDLAMLSFAYNHSGRSFCCCNDG